MYLKYIESFGTVQKYQLYSGTYTIELCVYVCAPGYMQGQAQVIHFH